MKILVLLALCSCLVISCETKRIPKDILTQPVMEKVLWDMLKADELAIYRKSKDSSFNLSDSSKLWYQKIYALHKTNENDFKRSFQFYEANPDLMQTILDSLQRHAQMADIVPAKKIDTKPKILKD